MALFEEAEDSFLVISTVNASLDSLLQHHRGTGWPKMVRELLDLLFIQVGARAAALVQVDTNLLPGLGPLFFGNFKGSADLDGVEVGWGIRILGVRPRFFPGLRPLCPG